jgi:hypothetical protein
MSLDLVERFGTLLEAAMYASVFWPEFSQVGEHTVLRDMFPHRDEGELRRSSGSSIVMPGGRQDDPVQDTWQWIEVYHLFGALGMSDEELARLGDAEGQAESLLEEYLGGVLSRTWAAKLRQDFPDEAFAVKLLPPQEPHGWIIYWVRT